MTTPPTPQPVDLMIDIETMGNTPGAAILSIGAVFIKDGRLAEEFYQKIDLQSCLDVGLKMDASTVLWWMKQSDEARAAICNEKGDHIIEVMGNFSRWAFANAGAGGVNVWGNASTFDVVLTEEAFRRTSSTMPWEFWGHRCFRTLKNLFPSVPKPEFTGIKHHALDDAKWQAQHMIAIHNHINCLQNALDTATTDLQNKYHPPQTNEQENPTIQSPGFAAAEHQNIWNDFWGSKDSTPPEDPAARVPGTP